jgi:hypothetical protein
MGRTPPFCFIKVSVSVSKSFLSFILAKQNFVSQGDKGANVFCFHPSVPILPLAATAVFGSFLSSPFS